MDVVLNEDDILDWHFLIHGREGTPYKDGVYHGRLVFPPTFPFGPPKILFLTPNGRFKVNERICFSLSDFHPEEWKPAYSVTAVLRGVYDYMHETTDTIGSIVATDSERRRLARDSMIYNRNNANFCKLFRNSMLIALELSRELVDRKKKLSRSRSHSFFFKRSSIRSRSFCDHFILTLSIMDI